MTLDKRFVVTSDLESYFVNKETGEPLAAGIVTFYSDVNRSTKKPVYQLTGSPPNYSYSVLPNPCILSGVGTFEDAIGNNIVPYYFPYEGTPSNSNGNVELYYITVESADEEEQFTREAWPNFETSDVTNGDNITNLIPNGQFLAHTDIVGSTQPPVQTISGIKVQYIAQGGWSFRRSAGGASIFNNSFERITSPISGLDDYPPYVFNFVCSSFDPSDLVRDLAIEFPGINSLSAGNPPGDQDYTFFFAGQSNDASTYIFDVRLIRNYGTGGSPSPQTDTSLGTVSIGPSYSYFTLNINGIAEASGTLGDNGDDYTMIALRGPASSFNVQVTDFVLAIGDIVINFYPVTTDAKTFSEGVAGWMPRPTANELYLPLVLTPQGVTFDTSVIGSVVPLTSISDFTGSASTAGNLLLADGKGYKKDDYSSLGIPYARLWAKYWNASINLPSEGTGPDFVSCYIPASTTNALRIVTNKAGSQTATADGTSATGFTFSTLYTGNNTYEMQAYVTTALNEIVAIGEQAGAVTAVNAGTSGFSVNEVINATGGKQVFYLSVSSLPAAGSYFTFSTAGGGNFYVWFKINGAGADPAPGGTGILVPLLSSYANTDAAAMIREAISGFQGSNVVTGNAASLTGGDYFTFYANSILYAVWYKIAGVGTAPVVAGETIQVTLGGGETAAQVATATQIAINSYMFAVPNLTGVFLRGWNQGEANIPTDPAELIRFALINRMPTDNLSTYQVNDTVAHFHSYTAPTGATTLGTHVGGTAYLEDGISSDKSFPVVSTASQFTTAYGTESRPFNYYVAYAIRY